MLSDVHLTVDGHPVPMEPDWQASSDAEGGYDRFSARVPLESIRRFSLGQESQAVLYDDSAEILWWGTLVQDPGIDGEIASLEAEGPRGDAEREAGRILYQSRELGGWVDGQDAPHNFTGAINDDITFEVVTGGLRWIMPRGEVMSGSDNQRAVLWAPGTPGGITWVAGTRAGKNASANADLGIRSFAGPAGSHTTVSDISAGPGAFGQAITTAEDGVILVYKATTGFTVGAKKTLRIVDLRVNGIWGLTGRATSRDIMYADEGVSDVFTRLGWGTSVEQKDVNVLPLDHPEGTFSELLSYLCTLVDFIWLAPLAPGGPGVFRDWGGNTHRIRNAVFDIAKLRLYNKVTVPYNSTSGAPLEVSAVPSPDPLSGVTREYVHEGLSDPQPNATLAQSVADTLAPQLGSPRFAGSAHVPYYGILPGDEIVHEDHGLGESHTHRVWSTTLSREGTTIGIEDRVSVEGLLGLAGLATQRRRKKVKPWTWEQKLRARRQTRRLRRKRLREFRKARNEFIRGLPTGLGAQERQRRIRRWERKNQGMWWPPVR